MPTTVPPGVVADGTWTVVFVTTIANPAAPSLATEINAGSSVDGSCLLTKDGLSLGVDVSTITDERLCSVQVFEENGTYTYTFEDIQYIIDPQNPTSASNKLYALLTANLKLYAVIRVGKSVDIPMAAGDKVWVMPIQVGPSIPLPPEANTKLRASQSVKVNGVVNRDVAVVA
jgi:hypothetical protein